MTKLKDVSKAVKILHEHYYWKAVFKYLIRLAFIVLPILGILYLLGK